MGWERAMMVNIAEDVRRFHASAGTCLSTWRLKSPVFAAQ